MELRQHTEQPVRHTLARALPALGLAMLALLFAAWYGFIRLGWRVASARTAHRTRPDDRRLPQRLCRRALGGARSASRHSALLTGLGAALIAGLPLGVVRVLLVLGARLVAIFAYIVRQHYILYAHNGGGAVAWFLGNVLWAAGLPVFRVVLWWMGFLVLTIAGERLELSRVMRIDRRGRALFAVAVGVFVLGTVLSHALVDVGSRVAGVGLAATGLWLLRYDIATRTVRRTGLPRFIAVCLLAGYAWLTIGGLMLAAFGGQVAGLLYDAILHSIFLGFVFTVIFGHAPIIFPSVLGARMDYHPRFYTHLALLHVSLLLRVAADLAGWVDGRLWGGLVNVSPCCCSWEHRPGHQAKIR